MQNSTISGRGTSGPDTREILPSALKERISGTLVTFGSVTPNGLGAERTERRSGILQYRTS